MSSELLEDDRLALKAALEAALPDEQLEPLKKKARTLADEIADSIEWSMKDNLAANLSYHVREMAGRAVEALLEGNEAEMVRWLSCDQRGYTGRSDGYNPNRTIEQQHPVIHGKLFDTGCLALRRKIVEAHLGIHHSTVGEARSAVGGNPPPDAGTPHGPRFGRDGKLYPARPRRPETRLLANVRRKLRSAPKPEQPEAAEDDERDHLTAPEADEGIKFIVRCVGRGLFMVPLMREPIRIRDLITEQRILDLEDQVRSLVAQNNALERERNEWRERARSEAA